jgi:hypothetical protein
MDKLQILKKSSFTAAVLHPRKMTTNDFVVHRVAFSSDLLLSSHKNILITNVPALDAASSALVMFWSAMVIGAVLEYFVRCSTMCTKLN